MNSSVSPLPIPIWPMLGLSLALLGATSVGVTLSARHAARLYQAQARAQTEVETAAPVLSRNLWRPAIGAG